MGPQKTERFGAGLPRDPARRSLISRPRRGASTLAPPLIRRYANGGAQPRDRPMNSSDPQLLVSTDWLAAHLSAPDLRILDASWHMPAAGRDARAEFEAGAHPRRPLLRHRRDRRRRSRACRTWRRRWRSSSRGCGRWASATATASSSTTASACSARRGSGGPSGCSARPTWRCSTAACRSGAPRAARSRIRPADAARPPLHRPPPRRPRPRRHPGRRHRQARRRPDRRRPRRRPLPRRGARAAAGPALRPHPGLEERAARAAWSTPTAR